VQSLSNIWKARDITNTIKVWLLKSLVWPIATYGCKGWTLEKADHRHFEDDREGDGQRTLLTGPVYKSTRQSASRRTITDGIMLCSPPTLLEDGTGRRRRRDSPKQFDLEQRNLVW